MAEHLSNATDGSGSSMPRIVIDVVTQHAEDASFLWLLRNRAVDQPHYSISDLVKLDDRLEAHLDGLRVASEDGWGVVQDVLTFNEPCDLFVAASLAFQYTERKRIDFVCGKLVEKPDIASGFVSALGWLPYELAKPHIEALVSCGLPLLRAAGVAAFAIHRVDPGTIFNKLIADDERALRARTLRAAGELGRIDLLPRIRGAHTDPDPDVRYAAAWSEAVLSPNLDALNVLRTIAEEHGPFSMKALQLAVRRMNLAASKAWQAWFSRRRDGLRPAIVAAGAIGDPELVLWLIGQMNVPVLARIAGEAFTMITGVDLASGDLARKTPDGFRAGPTDEPSDENVEMDPDEHLPWPDPALIQKWWTQNQNRFQKGTRYLLGKPISIEWLRQVLRIGCQRQRAAAALELAIRQPGQPLFEVRAPGFRQQAALK